MGFGVDYFWIGYVFIVFGIVGDGVVYVGDVVFVYQVDDQFQFVQVFEVGYFWCVIGFDQGFEIGFDQFDVIIVENGLFIEQVGFGFVFEGGFDDIGMIVVDVVGVGQGDVFGVVGSVLVDGDQVRDVIVFDEFGMYGVIWCFWCDYDYVEVGVWDDLVVVDGEVVSEGQGGVFFQVWFDFFFVQVVLEFVWGEDYDYVGCGDGGFYVGNFQIVCFGFGYGGGVVMQVYGDVDVGVFQVVGMGVVLGVVVDDGNFFVLDD